MKKFANGYRIRETPTQAKRTPKSNPIFECVPNKMVLSALTTAQISFYLNDTREREDGTYSDAKARHTPKQKTAAPKLNHKKTSKR